MWITTYSGFSCPWEVTDIMMVTGFGMLSNIEIFMNLDITLEFVEGVSYTVDAALIIDVVSVTDGDMLSENGLAAVITPPEFTLPAP